MKIALLWIAALGVGFLAAPALASDSDDLVRVSRDPYVDPAAQHATEVEPVLVAHGKTVVSAFQVGRFVGAGADNIGWATSTDGGRTWQRGFLNGTTTLVGGTWPRISLPVVAYDEKHGVFLIAMQQFDDNGDGRGILVSRSADGLHWSAPFTAASTYGQNGHWFGCDNHVHSPFYGNCYESWLDYSDGVTSRNPISYSSDGGKTWSAPVPSPDTCAGLPTGMAIQPNGQVSVIGRTDQLYAIISTDGGRSLQPTVNITTHQFDYPWLRSDPNPSVVVDSSGLIYAVFPDCRFRANCADPACRFEPTTSFCAPNDMVMVVSRNGVDWSSPSRIPLDALSTNVDHLIPGLAISSGNNARHDRLGLTFYFEPNANLPDGTTCDSSNCLVRAGAVFSDDGGRNWSEIQPIGKQMSEAWLVPTFAGEMVADYLHPTFVDDKLLAGFALAPTAADAQSGQFNENIYIEALED